MEKTFRKNPDVVYRVIAGEAILIPISRDTQAAGKMLTLNESGAFIWGLLDGQRNLEEIAAMVRDEYSIPEETAREDLLELVADLIKARAITAVGP